MAKHSSIHIDMTPMVDVVFLLLIFFMTTTSFKPPEEVAITLPSSHSVFEVPESGLILVTVGKNGEIFLGHNAQKGARVELIDFSQTLSNARQEDPAARIVIKADRDVPYSIMADIMDAMQFVNANTFSLVTDIETSDAGSSAAH